MTAMDKCTLDAMNTETRNVVYDFLNGRESFTHTDVSNQVKERVYNITGDVVGHRFVKDIVLNILNSGELGSYNFVRSSITVYPPNLAHGVRAFLYHPDDVDTSNYQSVQQDVWNPPNATVANATKAPTTSCHLDMSDDGATVSPQAKNGSTVTKQCSVQANRKVLNIPAIMVSCAGWNPGDTVQVDCDHSSNILTVKKSITGTQTVDGEGRIRIHGKNLEQIGKSSSDRCDTMLVNDNDCYIIVQ